MKHFICPNTNCNYNGKPKKIAKGSGIIFMGGIFLAIFFGLVFWPLGLAILIGALIYGVVCGGYNYVCPNCSMRIN